MASQGNGAFDRYAYVNNNPVRYNDPSGHYACGDAEESCYHEQQEKKTKIAQAKNKLDFMVCAAGDLNCLDSRDTLIALTELLERAPSAEEYLAMTAMAEMGYWLNNPKIKSLVMEALGRNFYEQGMNLVLFGKGFEVLMGFTKSSEGVSGAKERAYKLYKLAMSNTYDENRKYLKENINKWTSGREGDRPWNWYTLTPDPNKEPTFGYSPDNAAILAIDVGNGQQCWISTGFQDPLTRSWEAPNKQ